MSKRILYNFASRSRPDAFFTTLRNIRDFSSSGNYFVVAKLDDDDPAWTDYRHLLPRWKEVSAVGGKSTSKVDAINRDITGEYDIIVNISDDQRFTIPGFDDIIRKYCHLDSFVHFPDAYKKAACSTMSIIGRHYFNRTGLIYNPAYYSLWCDTEATEVAKLLGCYVYVPQIIFEHKHPTTTAGAEWDDLYRRNNTYKQDQKVYLQRRDNNFDLPFERTPYLLIKYATRGRWRLFFEAVDNIYATIRTNQFKILVSADYDDVEMNSNEVRQWCKRYPNVELHYGDHKSKVEAINAHMDPKTRWYWSIVMSDDMRFVEYGWDYKMLGSIQAVFGDSTDFFAHFNDGYVGDKLPTMNICGKKYERRFGYFYHPSYKSVSCDAENMYVARMLGKYHYFPEVYFNHLHPANLKEPSDHIYRRNHGYGEADTENYFARLKHGFGLGASALPEELEQYLTT